mgnify:CR=1 FL=1
MRMFSIAAIALLSACSGPAAVSYYQLPAATSANIASDAAKSFYVAPVEVATYLNGRGLVLQLSEIELSMARQHLWAEPLAQQVQRQLREQLASQLLYKARLSAIAADVVVYVQLDRFHGTHDGQAVISGRYQLSSHAASEAFSLQVPLEEDGYPALVKALNQGLEQLSSKISQQISKAEEAAAG